MQKSAVAPTRRVPGQVIAAVAAGLVVLLIWPLQAIVVGMIFAFVVMAAGVYALWMDRHPVERARRPARDQGVWYLLVGLAAVGTIATLVWTIPMGVIALALLAVASMAWGTLRVLARRPVRAARSRAAAPVAPASPASADAAIGQVFDWAKVTPEPAYPGTTIRAPRATARRVA